MGLVRTRYASSRHKPYNVWLTYPVLCHLQTAAALSVFVLAMALHPNVMRKAQAEIDEVVGPNRLPTFEDRDSLPYLRAVLKETLRWIPIVPLGL